MFILLFNMFFMFSFKSSIIKFHTKYNYKDIHKFAESQTAVRRGEFSPGDFEPFYDAVNTSYDYYNSASSGLQPSILKSAQLVFGFKGDFKSFHQSIKISYSNTVLSPLLEDGQILQEDKTTDPWDAILKEFGIE